MLTVDQKVQDFCHKYAATIKPSHKKFRRYKPPQYRANDPYLPINHEMDYDEEPMVELTMPVHSLNALADIDKFKGNLNRDYFKMLEEYEEECRIRHTNPAVRKAYEQYRMLLTLVR